MVGEREQAAGAQDTDRLLESPSALTLQTWKPSLDDRLVDYEQAADPDG